jgi:hypothetical protein
MSTPPTRPPHLVDDGYYVEPDDESRCHRCGGPNRSWHAPSPLWNAVMRGGDINGPWKWNEIICPTCFMVLAEGAGIAERWRLDARTVKVELATTTPSGRVWDPERDLWVEPEPLGERVPYQGWESARDRWARPEPIGRRFAWFGLGVCVGILLFALVFTIGRQLDATPSSGQTTDRIDLSPASSAALSGAPHAAAKQAGTGIETRSWPRPGDSGLGLPMAAEARSELGRSRQQLVPELLGEASGGAP